jgi:hypothetical protein
MLTFLHSLATDGRVRVAAARGETADVAAIEQAIRAADAAVRPTLAGDAPPLSLVAAAWALDLLEWGCRFLVHREHDAAAVAAALGRLCPEAPSPSACYSADLFLRHLPDLYRLARGVADDDPLVVQLAAVGRAWPLSSVGMALTGEVDCSSFMPDPALRQLYADRILARGDVGRLGDGAVRQAVRESVGDHGAALAPAAIAAALTEGA